MQSCRPLFEKYFKEDPEFLWVAAPKPRLADESYEKNYYYNRLISYGIVFYSICAFTQPAVLWKFVTLLPGGTRLSQAFRNESSRVISMTGITSSR